jgi:heparan-alpha-glucosaminide N-acetyltransferase
MSTTIELPSNRLVSVDAYRGTVMFLMLAEVLHLGKVAEALPDSKLWSFLAYHQSHIPWIGCTLHDLIQPSFSMLVGVVLPFSLENRRHRGESNLSMTLHALLRSLLLIFLGIFLRSLGREQTNFTFDDTLTQIGMGYFFLYLLGRTNWKVQLLAFLGILIGYWGFFAAYPLPGPDFDWAKAGVPADWEHHLKGFSAHWNKNTNPAWAFDGWWMNLFPRKEPFTHSGGGYCTLSFIPTLGTMVLGLLTGQWLMSDRDPWRKVIGLVLAGAACFGIAYAAAHFDICPIVKRIWTPAWVFYAGGWGLVILACYYTIVDVLGFQKWALPLIVIGSNSIVAYCSEWVLYSPIRAALDRHIGQKPFELAGPAYEPFLHGVAVLLIVWLILFWMYRKRIFVRI